MGFVQSENEQALFIRVEDDGSLAKFLVYIDDSLYYYTDLSKDHVQRFEEQMTK